MLSDFRPVPLMSNVMKVLEKLVLAGFACRWHMLSTLLSQFLLRVDIYMLLHVSPTWIVWMVLLALWENCGVWGICFFSLHIFNTIQPLLSEKLLRMGVTTSTVLSEWLQFAQLVWWFVILRHHRGQSCLHSCLLCSPQVSSTTVKHATCRSFLTLQ